MKCQALMQTRGSRYPNKVCGRMGNLYRVRKAAVVTAKPETETNQLRLSGCALQLEAGETWCLVILCDPHRTAEEKRGNVCELVRDNE